ncbi:MAG: succinate dehydrogenase, cytochrome b556 subunit, partial [Pseudomonadota bacterium]
FGLTWVFFQHLCSGIRHLIMDSGEGFDLDTSRTLAITTLVASTLLTILTWIVIAMTKGL